MESAVVTLFLIAYSFPMTSLLLIQSRKRPEMVEGEQGEYTRALAGTGVALSYMSVFDDTIDWQAPEVLLAGHDGIILGGSGEYDFDGGRPQTDDVRAESKAIVERLRPLLDYVFANEVPLLGVCYGHQIVSEYQGVPVVNDLEQKKVGSHVVCLTEEGKFDPLLAGLPERFIGQYGHKDSLSALPPGAVLLATGPSCNTSAVRYGSRIYTLQFHPELTEKDVAWKLANSPGYLPEGMTLDELIKPSPEASTLIPRFAKLTAS